MALEDIVKAVPAAKAEVVVALQDVQFVCMDEKWFMVEDSIRFNIVQDVVLLCISNRYDLYFIHLSWDIGNIPFDACVAQSVVDYPKDLVRVCIQSYSSPVDDAHISLNIPLIGQLYAKELFKKEKVIL